jgi:hypothetical protein
MEEKNFLLYLGISAGSIILAVTVTMLTAAHLYSKVPSWYVIKKKKKKV